jgi:hypothetical protein
MDFVNGAVVRWNGSNRTTMFVSSTQLTAAIPASDLATAGTANVVVFNPAPGGGVSNIGSFTIVQPNPMPAITSLSPSSATAGRPGLTLSVSGDNFINGSVVRWNGSDRATTFVRSSLLSAEITEADLSAPGAVNITVFNPAPGGGLSNVASFRITDPVPTITDLGPHTVTTGGPAFTLTVTGFNFNAQSKVNWNGSERPTTFVNSKQLTAAIPATDIAASGRAVVTVVNPAATGGASAYASLLINDLNLLAVDEGSPNIVFRGFENIDRSINRLTPAFYPATLSQVLIWFDSPVPFVQEILVGTNPGGGSDISNVSFQSVATPVSVGQEGRFFVYNVPNVTITSGDFVIGYRANYWAFDNTLPSRGRSYTSLVGGSLNRTGSNLLIRARLTQPCLTVTNINPTSASPGASVTLIGANFTGVTAVKFANNITAQFAINSDTQITAIVPNGAVSGPITISKQGCTEARTVVFTITNLGYEADVAPRPNGSNNGTITVSDWTQVGRFVAGLDTTANGGEFQRADCAPRSTLGDGRLTASDWVQAGRYASGEDPVVVAGGPASPVPSSTASTRMVAARAAQLDEARLLRVSTGDDSPGRARTVRVELDAQGDESALGFSLRFNPSEWRFVSAEAGLDARQAVIHVNAKEAARGQIGLVLALPAGGKFRAGRRRIVSLKFASTFEARAKPLAFVLADEPVAREIVNREAAVLPARYEIKSTPQEIGAVMNVVGQFIRGDDETRAGFRHLAAERGIKSDQINLEAVNLHPRPPIATPVGRTCSAPSVRDRAVRHPERRPCAARLPPSRRGPSVTEATGLAGGSRGGRLPD